jgi:modulator of FtsH protease HflK
VRENRLLRSLGRLAAPALLLAWLASGIYSVEPDESAVGFVLGRAVARDVLPGMHWNPPWPLGRVEVARTATSFMMPVGFRLLRDTGAPVSELWLTGDTNVVTARLTIQYRIRSLTDFLLASESPRELLRRAGEREVTRFMGGDGVDAILTRRQGDLRTAVREGVQALVDAEGVGIDVQSVTLEELAPPRQGAVRNAFQAVQDASADRERSIFEARAYLAQTLAEARGEADRLRSEAQGERHRRTAIAQGEAERFASLAREHARAPEVTEQRLYLETLERLLPRIETYMVEPGADGRVQVRVLP